VVDRHAEEAPGRVPEETVETDLFSETTHAGRSSKGGDAAELFVCLAGG
jgi:hypothetical protein